MSLPEPPSKIRHRGSHGCEEAGEAGRLIYPSFAPGHSWAVSMALEGPQLGLGRTEGWKEKGREGGIDLSLQSWCQNQSGGRRDRKVTSEFSPSDQGDSHVD